MGNGPKIFAWLITLGFVYVAWPLLIPVAMGGVFAVLFIPLLEKMEKRKLSTGLASGLLTLGITILILLPVTALLVSLAKSGFEQIQSLRHTSPTAAGGGDFWGSLIESPRFAVILDRVGLWLPIGKAALIEAGQDLFRSVGAKLADILGGLVAQLPGMAMGLVVIVVSLYFFLVDGRKLVAIIRTNSVFTPMQTDSVLKTTAVICRSVILASLVSGGAQALVEFLACVVTGTPDAALIGMLVFLGSFVPLIGSAPVTLFVAAQQLFLDRTGVAIALFVAAAIVSAIDNLIRPLFLKGSANLHPLVAFVAAFGGLQTLGFMGIFLGPVIAAIFLITLQIVFGKKELQTGLQTTDN